MDLDKIKKEWQETPVEVNIGEEKIGRMIDNEGKSAFRRLILYEKIGVLALIVCFFIAGVFKYKELIIIYQVSIFLAFLWQLYKYRYVRKIDMATMSILDVSIFYFRYKKWMTYETAIALIWFLFFGIPFIYHWHKQVPGKAFLTFFCVMWGVAFIICAWVIWVLVWKNIRQLGKSIQEVKELEMDNK